MAEDSLGKMSKQRCHDCLSIFEHRMNGEVVLFASEETLREISTWEQEVFLPCSRV